MQADGKRLHMYSCANSVARFEYASESASTVAAFSFAASSLAKCAPTSGALALPESPATSAAVTAAKRSVALGPSAAAYSHAQMNFTRRFASSGF